MAGRDLDQRIEDMRRFNRFYTRKIGVLQEGMLRSPLSLAEVRVLYELAHRDDLTLSRLTRDLAMDAGYVSRILRAFEKRGMVAKNRSESDSRQILLRLTKRGQEVFTPLSKQASDEIRGMLGGLPETEQIRLIAAMRTIEHLLGERPENRVSYILRPHQIGDMGWVAHRHGMLYAQEYGWNEHFEALVAGIVAKFIQHYDPDRERCWIAEKEGEIVGSVFLVKQSKTTGKLRLLLVEPEARGLGIGTHLVKECERFARNVGYRKILLWTNSILGAARHIYTKSGFRKIAEEPHHSFGHDLVGETWELKL